MRFWELELNNIPEKESAIYRTPGLRARCNIIGGAPGVRPISMADWKTRYDKTYSNWHYKQSMNGQGSGIIKDANGRGSDAISVNTSERVGDKRKRDKDGDAMSEEEETDQEESLEWREVICPHCKGCVKYCLKIDNHTQHWVQLLFHLFTIISVWLQWVLTSS